MRKNATNEDSLRSLFRRTGKKGRKLTHAEMKLWRTVTDTVEPMGDRAPLPQPEPVDSMADLIDADQPRPSAPPKGGIKRPSAPQPVSPQSVDLHSLDHGVTAGVDKRTAKRFTRGKMDIEGRLDLHGKTQVQAHQALIRLKSPICNGRSLSVGFVDIYLSDQ